MANSTAHIRKRQYQPSITSFLGREPKDGSSPLSPPLPEETQSSLLTVGMRVRKSVPEGYKTHKTIGTPAFPFPNSSQISSSAPVQSRPPSKNSRELMPFCGLFKTGGWAAQEIPPSSAPAIGGVLGTAGDGEDVEVLPELSVSQNTLQSTQSSIASSASQDVTSRKRTYEAEAEAEIDEFFAEFDGHTEDMNSPQPVDSTRRIAKPRSSRLAVEQGPSSIVVNDKDFEEAAFLAPMELDR